MNGMNGHAQGDAAWHREQRGMTDRELLELAAKAAGYNEFEGHAQQMLDSGWNPLTDDGGALRLAVRLKFKIEHHYYEGEYYCRIRWDGLAWPVMEKHMDDPYAATRRAIVRAAAEIGKAMK